MAGRNAYSLADFTRFYDWCYEGFEADIPWYLKLAQGQKGAILEIACGTGRITLPLARAGYEVVGLDLSEPMLALARRKCSFETKEVRDAISFVQGDMTDFTLNRTFACVFVPNASLFNLRDAGSQNLCIRHIFKHTAPGGIVALDLVAPRWMANQEVDCLRLEREGVNPLTGFVTQECNRTLRIDRQRQVVRKEHVYLEREGGCEEKRYSFTQDYRWIEAKEGIDFLCHCGFSELETLGNYDGSPFTNDSARLLFVGKRNADTGQTTIFGLSDELKGKKP
jgi:SAM-dependent methyltransferase